MDVQIVLAYPENVEMSEVIQHLERQGWKTSMAHTGTEALSLIEQLRPLAALLYVNLPDITGWDVLERVRTSPLLKPTTVMLLYPSEGPEEDVFRGFRLGADVSMSPPYNPLEIVAFLSRIVRFAQME